MSTLPGRVGLRDSRRSEVFFFGGGVCGGRVVILLYCPSCFLVEIGLYWHFRQISLRADVDWALLLFLSVDRLCPYSVCALSAGSVCP